MASIVNTSNLHDYLLDKALSRTEQMMLVLAVHDEPLTTSQVKEAAVDSGLRQAAKWNVSDTLGKASPDIVKKSGGWILARSGRERLDKLGFAFGDALVASTQSSLRQHLAKIQSQQATDFVSEAISCFEAGFHRSAVVLSWVGAVSLLHEHVVNQYLNQFNAEATRRDNRWKPAKTADDLGKMKEHDFLDVLESISVLGKNTKQQLQQCLKLRNGCGHPNTLQLADHSVASHLELLMLNVYSVYG